MAKNKKQKKPAAKKGSGKKKTAKKPKIFLIGLFLLIFLLIASLPSVIFLFFALLPTVVAYFTDRTPEKSGAICVGSMNMAGSIPSLWQLWFGANSVEQAVSILTDPFSLVVIYGAAAFGWALFLSIPTVVMALTRTLDARRVSALRTNQRQLVEEWGDAVTEDANDAKEAK